MTPSATTVASARSDLPRAAPAFAARLGQLGAAVAIACALPGAARAQTPEGGLYIAGYGFGFVQAAQQAMAKNPPGRRFFVLALPPNTDALTQRAPRSTVTVRDRVVARGGVLLVCQRDLDSGAVR
ncbi:MAG: hypothetical protein J0L57_11660, partial [Burkholderiales bacterium]|nr:hypothetical protein [Burkholderiales bacterium]